MRQMRMAYGLSLAVLFLLCVSFIVMISKSPRTTLFDETDYLYSVPLLLQHGFSIRFLNELPGAAGPLYTAVHYVFMPLTHLQPPAVRFVNPILMIGTMLMLTVILRRRGAEYPFATGFSLIAAPVFGVLAGLALTTMPAIFFLTLSLWALHSILTAPGSSVPVKALYAVVGGVCMSLAIVGRQPYFVLLIAVALLAFLDDKNRSFYLAFTIASMLLPACLFFVWQGLTPPSSQSYYVKQFNIRFVILAMAYASMILYIWSPKWFGLGFVRNAFIFLIGFWACFVFGYGKFVPMHSFSERLGLDPYFMDVYSKLTLNAAGGLATIFLAAMLYNMWSRRKDPFFVFVCTGVLLLLASNLIMDQFSSRYVSACLPLLLIASASYDDWTLWKPVRLMASGAVGLLCLYFYYWGAVV